jgi:hypothetical protein
VKISSGFGSKFVGNELKGVSFSVHPKRKINQKPIRCPTLNPNVLNTDQLQDHSCSSAQMGRKKGLQNINAQNAKSASVYTCL